MYTYVRVLYYMYCTLYSTKAYRACGLEGHKGHVAPRSTTWDALERHRDWVPANALQFILYLLHYSHFFILGTISRIKDSDRDKGRLRESSAV